VIDVAQKLSDAGAYFISFAVFGWELTHSLDQISHVSFKGPVDPAFSPAGEVCQSREHRDGDLGYAGRGRWQLGDLTLFSLAL